MSGFFRRPRSLYLAIRNALRLGTDGCALRRWRMESMWTTYGREVRAIGPPK